MFGSIFAALFNILFFTVPLIFYPKTSEVFEFNKMVSVYFLTLLVIGAWVAKMIISKKIVFRRTILDIPLLIFLLSQIVSTLFSIDPRTSILGYYGRFQGGLLSTLSFSFLYWAYVSNMDKRGAKSNIVALLVGGVVVALYGALEHFGASPSCLFITGEFNVDCWVQDVKLRVFATLGQPNWMAAYVVALIPLSMMNVLERAKEAFQKDRKFWFASGISLLFFLALLFTKSRSGVLGFLVADALFWGLLFLRKRSANFLKILLTTNLLFILAAFLVGTPWTPSLGEIGKKVEPTPATAIESGGTESGEIRKIVWKGAIEIWKHNPIFGTGPETFAYSYYQFRPLEHNLVSEWDFLYNKAHNEYLNLAANTGAFGLLTYAGLVGTAVYMMYKKGSIHILAGFVSILITNFFGFSVVVVSLLFFLYPAIAHALEVDEEKETLNTKLPWSQKLGLALTLIALLFGLWNAIGYWKADLSYANAKALESEGEIVPAIEELNRAIAVSPKEAIYHNQLSYVHTSAALALADQGEEESAKKFAEEAVKESDIASLLSPRNTNIQKGRSNIFTNLSGINEDYILKAVDTLENLTTLAPTDPKVYFKLGGVYAKMGDLDQARESLEKAVTLKPNYKEARLSLSALYEDLGEKEKAKDELEYILTNIAPDDEATKKSLQRLTK